MAFFNLMFIRLSSSYFFYFALLGLTSPFLAVYLDGKGFDSRQVGESLAILTATKIIAPSLWSFLADKTGKPLFVIRLGSLLTLLSFSLLFFLNQYWPITFSLALFTLFWTAVLPQLEVHALATLKHSSKKYARVRLWGSIGFIVLAIVSGEAISVYGYQVFTLLGFIILLGLLFSTLALTDVNSAAKSNASHSPIISKVLAIPFVCFFIAGILLQVSFGPYYGFFALFLRDLHYSALAVGLLISLGVVAEIIAFIYMGTLFKYCSLKTLLVFSIAITGVRWLLMPVVADSVLLLSILQLSHAASFAVYHSASMQFISSHFEQSQQSRGQGIYLGGVYGVGGAIGAYITGLMWLDGQGATNTFLFCGCCGLLGGLIMALSKK
ncbi:MFS transporter [Colwelliaceae bacterium MEBiC 14330]